MNITDNLSILYEAYDTCEDTMMILDAYDEHTFDYIDNYMVQHESIFSKAKDYVQRHGGFLSTLKHLGNQALEFLRTMWKTFTGAVGKFIGKIINFTKGNKDKNDNLPQKVLSYQISFDARSFKDKIDRVSSKSFLNNKFFTALGNIARSIKKFATDQIDNLMRFISNIFKRFKSNTESVLIYRSEQFMNEAGKAYPLKDIIMGKNDEIRSIYSRTDRIDVNNRMLNKLDDVHYKIILESQNVVKAYNCFLIKKYQEYDKYNNYIISGMRELDEYLKKNALKSDIYSDDDGKVHLKPGLEKFRAAFQKIYETVLPDRTEYGNAILGITDELTGNPDVSLQDKMVDDITTRQNVFYSDYSMDDDYRSKQIRDEIKLRLNYNVHMRKILSNVVKLNYAFFKLSEAEAEIISEAIKDQTNDSGAIHKALDLIKGQTKRFIEYPGKMNFRKIGAGIIYYSTERFDLRHPERDASSLFPLAMRYDYILTSHGVFDVSDKWRIVPVNIEGVVVDDVNDAIYEIVKQIDKDRQISHNNKPVKIFIDACNETMMGDYALQDSILKLVKKKNILLVYPRNPLDSPENTDVATRMYDVGYK